MTRDDRGAPRLVRVLIVDDSALMRKLLAEVLTATGEIEVVATARDGDQALLEARRVRPDVITLDVQMPGRSGLEILPELLATYEVPVVMVSSLTQEGADVTLAALELGAVDYMPKPERFQFAEMRQSGHQLVSKILTAAQSRVRRPTRTPRAESASRDLAARKPTPPPRTAPRAVDGPTGTVAVIGISTGGPQTLAAIVPELEPPIPPILIVQHMPPRFTGFFADRLDRQCSLTVKEADEGDPVLPGQILIAPGGKHMMVSGAPPKVHATLSDAPPTSGHKPSIDVLFQSAARVYGPGAVGFIMTGMGRDGVDGCKAILAAGGDTYGQDEATSVVFGMNKAAIQEGAVRAQFNPDDLPAILRLLGRRSH